MITKSGSARWQGDLKTGTGLVSTESGVLEDQAYSFARRFEGEKGTNPEELIGAAHASCYAMALSMILGDKGITVRALDANASVTLEEADGGFAITKVHLFVRGDIEGGDQQMFEEAAEAAKAGCPVSKLLNAEITMEASVT